MPTDHWSAAQFQTWDLCPTTYRERYVDGLAQTVTDPMRFGSAVHQALQAHYNGQDGDHAFKLAWDGSRSEAAYRLTVSGLRLLQLVYDLNLSGVSEQRFSLPTDDEWRKPTIGFIDLIDYDRQHVYDFKTTVGEWGPGRANQDPWQPTLYRLAAKTMTEGADFDFSYVTLNKRTCEVAIVQPTIPHEQRLAECLAAGVFIATMDHDGDYPCRGGHGTCPECAGTWQHGHVCNWDLLPPRIHIARKPVPIY